MNGLIRRVIGDKGFGFLSNPLTNKEYFFHKTEFIGHWNDLVEDYNKDVLIKVTFEETNPQPQRGPRAYNVMRTDWPNRGD
jgi:cold shock CspA family protein